MPFHLIQVCRHSKERIRVGIVDSCLGIVLPVDNIRKPIPERRRPGIVYQEKISNCICQGRTVEAYVF